MTAPRSVPAPRPALVVRVHVVVGQEVDAGDPLVTTETMKCESVVTAPTAGVVTDVAAVGAVVATGDLLVTLRPSTAPARPPGLDEVLAAALAESGRFTEHDLAVGCDGSDVLVPVDRNHGGHTCGLLVGVIEHPDQGGPMRRVFLAGDPSRSLGAVAEAECRRVLAAIDLADSNGWALEWAAVSAGAVISLESGTENMDWCAAVVARLVRFTQCGGEVVVVTTGPNVGAQSYWNAEATMLGHCAGMLVMVDGSAMVLTGRRALGLAGGATEDDDQFLGGYHHVMGPNGEAHHRARDVAEAFALVRTHHRLNRERPTTDRADRSICHDPYEGAGDHRLIGDVLDAGCNPDRKRPFSVRPLMSALVDRGDTHLERWPDHRGADGAVVWDCRIDGLPTTLIGIESHHRPPTDPAHPAGGWTGATLYPASSKKVARAINAASGRRPVVVLANLAGFDGSRWSLEHQQLEWGAEIARAVVNFDGRIIVVVIGRFHGGAYVVFNRRLHPDLVMLAVEGTRVSVIGGSAAAEVLRAEVRRLAEELERTGLSSEDARAQARSMLAERFDDVHDVGRAHRLGSVDQVIPAELLRPSVIERLRPGRSRGVRRPGPRPAGRTAAPA